MIRANQRQVWTDSHQEQFDRAERLIDEAIQDSDEDVVSVDISSVTTSNRVVDSLRRAYNEGGWDVSVVPIDGMDPGLLLKLQVKGEPRSGPGGE